MADQPIDQLGDFVLNHLGDVSDHALFKFSAYAILTQQVEYFCQPEGIIKIILAALVHLVQDFFDICHAEFKIALHIRLIKLHLALDITQHVEIFTQYIETGLKYLLVPVDEIHAYSHRILQLEPQAAFLVQCAADIIFQCSEAALIPQIRLTCLSAQGQSGADGKGFRRDAKQAAGILLDERFDGVKVIFIFEDVDFVDDEDDFLTPIPNAFKEQALAFGEWAVDGGHKQNQVRAGNELGSDGLVRTDDGVGAGSVYDADLAEPFHRQAQDVLALVDHFAALSRAVTQQVDLGRGGCDAFLEQPFAKESIDESALAGIELAHDNQQEQVIQLCDRFSQRLLVFGSGIVFDQVDAQVAKYPPLVLEQSFLAFSEYPHL